MKAHKHSEKTEKNEFSGVDEMKSYLKVILSRDVKAVAFLCGLSLTTLEGLQKSLTKPITKEKIQYFLYGRLMAIVDLFFAYLDLVDEHESCSNDSYVS